MRRFFLDRKEDESGVSGTGRIAQGCQFDNGWCALTWLTGTATLSWYASIEELLQIHGHGGKTNVIWKDQVEGDDEDLHQ